MSIEGVNRGYLKIEGATRAFDFDFKDKIVLDIGSSTGGFTEYALNHGAKQVIAVEKGSHQMKSPLRFNPRIELHEKTDIFDVVAEKHPAKGLPEHNNTNLNANHPQQRLSNETLVASVQLADRARSGKKCFCVIPDVVVADVSFISLTKILAYAKQNLADHHTEFLVMLKPQFEALPYQLKKGIVKNETTRRQIIKRFEQWLKANNYVVIAKHDNELHGKTGNIERFYYLKLAK